MFFHAIPNKKQNPAFQLATEFVPFPVKRLQFNPWDKRDAVLARIE
jgi:hypothetical protein